MNAVALAVSERTPARISIIRKKAFTPIEIVSIHNAANSVKGGELLSVVIALAAHTGATLDELFSIKVADIQFESDVYTVGGVEKMILRA